MSSRSSIFSFRTLRSVPSAVIPLLTVLLLAGLMLLAGRFFFNRSHYLYLLDPYGAITAMDRLCREIKRGEISGASGRSVEEKMPEIILAGDSRNLFGIIPDIIEEKTGAATSSVVLAASTIWEPSQCMKLFEPAFERCRVLVFDLSPAQFMEFGNFLQLGNSYMVLRRRFDHYPGYVNASRYSWKNDYFPVRLSLHQVIDIVVAMRKNTADPDAWRRASNPPGDYHPDYTPEKVAQSLAVRRAKPFNDRLLPAMRYFLEETERRNIRVIFNCVPTFQGRTFMHGVVSLPPELCDTELDRAYEALRQELEKRENVVFIGPRRFSDIGVDQDESLLFVDDHHLSGIGAQFYSRYLAEEILNHSCLSASAGQGASPPKN
ncbi:MAG: hypothetical protein J6S75_15625 [Thermoguttaceae bacterium]|nr:hypothetical protein [Thermoguttaceae bacterium]